MGTDEAGPALNRAPVPQLFLLRVRRGTTLLLMAHGMCLPDGSAVTVDWSDGRPRSPRLWQSAQIAAGACGAELIWIGRAPGPRGTAPPDAAPREAAPREAAPREAATPTLYQSGAELSQPTYRHNRRLDGDRVWLSGTLEPGAPAS